MSDAIYKVLVLGIVTGAISMVITKGAIFNKAHEWLEKRSPFLENMLSCPWCTSHWVALFFTLIYHPLLVNAFLPVDYIVTVFAMVTVASVTSWVIWNAYHAMMS